MKKTFTNKGFTLVELLIAMAIFVMFTGIVIRSYADIIYSQRGANEYRLLYAEARSVLDNLTEEIRENSLYFGANVSSFYNTGSSEITMISKDTSAVKSISSEDGRIIIASNVACGKEKNKFFLSDERVFIEELSFYVTPAFDPYLEENSSFNSLQFQPKVTVFMKVSKGNYEIDFQTTISSRNYSATPAIDITCIK